MFDLKGKRVSDVTIDLTEMKQGDRVTFRNGTVSHLTIYDQAGVQLIVEDVIIQGQTILK